MFDRLLSVWKQYRNEDNVLVYQFGKVGSTSLESSLPGSIHTHMMYGHSPCYVHLQQRRSGIKRVIGALGDWIKRRAIRKRDVVNVITIVREPVSRNTSMFFQDLAHWVYEYVGNGNHDNRFAGREYLENVFYETFDQDYVQRWFNEEFVRFTGIDLLNKYFDSERGYEIYEEGKFRVLILRYENISLLPTAVKEFLGKEITIEDANIGDDKWYGVLYKEFKRNFKPNEKYLDRILSLPYVKHFYTESEIQKIKSKYE